MQNETYTEIFRDLTTSAKQLILNEVELIKVEAKDLTTQATANITQAILFGALLVVSAVPLLAAAVLYLGQYWDGDYALSALVVGAVCAAVSGLFLFRSIRNLSEVDAAMPATSQSLKDGAEVMQRKSSQLSTAVAGV